MQIQFVTLPVVGIPNVSLGKFLGNVPMEELPSATGYIYVGMSTHLAICWLVILVLSCLLLLMWVINLSLQHIVWMSTSEVQVCAKLCSTQKTSRYGSKYDFLWIVCNSTLQFLRAMDSAGAVLFSKALLIYVLWNYVMHLISYECFWSQLDETIFSTSLFLFLFTFCVLFMWQLDV